MPQIPVMVYVYCFNLKLICVWLFNSLYFVTDDFLDFSNSAIFPADDRFVGGDDARMTGHNILDKYSGYIVLPDLGKSIDYFILCI